MHWRRPKGATSRIAALLLAAGFAAVPAAAQLSVETGFDPVVARLANRPATLIETDYYVYGPDTGFIAPELSLTIQKNDLTRPVTLYIYRHNRVDGTLLYVNVERGLTNEKVDVFGDPGLPRRIRVASLEQFKLFGEGGALGSVLSDLDAPTGRYQFVLEIRDEKGEEVLARSNTFYNHVDSAVSIEGGETTGETWSAGNAYFLEGVLRVTEGVLTIPAGTVVLGAAGAAIFVEQGARIEAFGEPLDPVIFSSDFPAGQRAPGDWGGLVLNGEAPTNQGLNPPPRGIADSGTYGGDDPNDSSGALAYARIEYAGIGRNQDLNGLTLQGVGSGTVIDNLQVHLNLADGIEIRGGTVNARNVYVSGAEHDSLDWREGWTGRLQFFVANQCASDEHRSGINGSNDGLDANDGPVSNPSIRNVTLVGDGNPNSSADGLLLREGTKAAINNSVIVDFSGLGIGVEGEASNSFLFGEGITVDDTILFANLDGDASSDLEAFGSNMIAEDPIFLNDPRGRDGCGVTPDLTFVNRVNSGSNFSDAFFESAPYIGAIDPDRPWTNTGFLTFVDD